MLENRRSSVSVYDYGRKQKKTKTFLDIKLTSGGRQLTVGIVIGVILTIITIVLQCIAFFTPHWKEITPNTHTLYVDGVDALIRTEVLIYFDAVHRFTHHSYGLFQRCEYLLNNSSKLFNEQNDILNTKLMNQQQICTKNFIPSYDDKQFNECHSLQYYRFCSNKGIKNFDINNDYLRATFDLSSNSHLHLHSTSSCVCHYPLYIKTCHVLGILSLISLFLMTVLFAIFPCLKTRHQRLKIKCFAVLSSLLSMLFILSTLLTILNHLEHESIEYLTAIERHYRSSQIYKLSQDTKVVISRFLSSINIGIGYSTILAWISFVLSIIDGILLMMTCKVENYQADIPNIFTGIALDSPRESLKIEHDDYGTPKSPLNPPSSVTETQQLLRQPTFSPPPPPPSQPPPPPPPPPSPPQFPPTILVNHKDNQSNEHSPSPPPCIKHSSIHRIHFEDEV